MTTMSFEEFKKFMTEYYPEDCYDDDVIRDFYNRGFYIWNLERVVQTLEELTDKIGKRPIIQLLITELIFIDSKKGGI
jgi:hypothetical protein